MYITNKELKSNRRIWKSEFSSIYELENGLIAKHLKKEQPLFEIKLQKIMYAYLYQMVKNLAAPVDVLSTEDGIVGYIQKPKLGVDFSEYYTANPYSVDLDTITSYIVNLERTVRECHRLDMYFPDLASRGNVLFNPVTKEVSIIDYDGCQIQGLDSLEISAFLKVFEDTLLCTKKYYKDGVYNKNVDILTLTLIYFYYCTKLNIQQNMLYDKSIMNFMINQIGLKNTMFADCILRALSSEGDNDYIEEAILDLNKNYILTPNVQGNARMFIKK